MTKASWLIRLLAASTRLHEISVLAAFVSPAAALLGCSGSEPSKGAADAGGSIGSGGGGITGGYSANVGGHVTGYRGSSATGGASPVGSAPATDDAQSTGGVSNVGGNNSNLRSEEYYQSVGDSYLATNIFDGGTTHFIKAGAVEMATLVVGEIRKNNGPLAAYLK